MVVTLEEGVANGGFGEAVAAWYMGKGITVLPVALPDKFIEHGSVTELKEKYGLDKNSIAERILANCSLTGTA
jgi:1-deoxy-D-xylulose-5-phosphate synthase